jgi:hypothetical protein
MEHRFRLQESWLGCNGVISLTLLVVAIVLAFGALLRSLERRAR